jgi:RpiR family carbohydrate utilization transcriptional regulator
MPHTPTADPTQPFYNRMCFAVIRDLYPSMYEAEQRIADYVMNNPQHVLDLTASELATQAQTATSTVVRFCQKLGFSGYREFKLRLARDLVTPVHLSDLMLTATDSIDNMVYKVFRSNIQNLVDSSQRLDLEQITRAIDAISKATIVYLVGVGSSVAIVYDLYYWFGRIGVPAHPLVDPNLQRIIAAQATPNMVFLGISHSGATRDTVETLRLARELGATTIAMTNYSKSPIASVSTILLVTASQATTLQGVSMTSRVVQMGINDVLVLGVAKKQLARAEKVLDNTAKAVLDQKITKKI